jgi:O-antigen chain-terminating methyltransferase
MILPTNPEIDVEALMKRVRRDAERIRASGAIEQRRAQTPAGVDEGALLRALDRHRSVTATLNRAEQENLPRADIPRRLAMLGPLRRVVRVGLRIFNYAFKQQREFNASILQADREMIFMLATLGDVLAETLGQLALATDRIAQLESPPAPSAPASDVLVVQARLDATDRALQAIQARLDATPSAVQVRLDIVDALRDVERRLAVAQESLLRNDALLRSDLLTLRRASDGGASKATSDGDFPAPSSSGNDALHAAIADRFRGDRETLGRRFAQYLPYVMDAGTIDAEHPLLDIGSGRGEWLVLLHERNIAAVGTELNELLVNEARTSGVDVRHEDGLAWLRACPAASLGAVSAFHVVEHLAFDDLCSLLREAQRALVPGGLLLLETPDPRNVVVSTRTFYFDPTHRKPIPAELLEFLVTSFGYAETIELELHAPQATAFADDDALGTKLNGFFSRAADYAIIARAPRA